QLSSTPFGSKDEIAYLGAERQDKYQRYGWNMPVERIVGTGLYRSDIPLDALSGADRRRIRRTLERLAVAHLAPRRLLSLSYGERRVILLARVLVSRPRLLLLDEVLNGLDEINRARVLRWLARQTGRLPWVLATHRLEEVPPGATAAARRRCCARCTAITASPWAARSSAPGRVRAWRWMCSGNGWASSLHICRPIIRRSSPSPRWCNPGAMRASVSTMPRARPIGPRRGARWRCSL